MSANIDPYRPSTPFPRSPEDELVELAHDLDACWPQHHAETALESWVTTPAILRRVVTRLAQLVPAGTDRLIVHGPAAHALGAGTALVTGLPWAPADADPNRESDERRTSLAIDPADFDEQDGAIARLSVLAGDDAPPHRGLLRDVGGSLEVAS